jgi:hypothetical protein
MEWATLWAIFSQTHLVTLERTIALDGLVLAVANSFCKNGQWRTFDFVMVGSWYVAYALGFEETY